MLWAMPSTGTGGANCKTRKGWQGRSYVAALLANHPYLIHNPYVVRPL